MRSEKPEIEETLPWTQQQIIDVCDGIKELLLTKNRKYGDSALNPTRIFSKASPVEQIKVRIDDKLSRVISGQEDEDEDIIKDFIGYLILLTIAQRYEEQSEVK
jgi:hypothetical protein